VYCVSVMVNTVLQSSWRQPPFLFECDCTAGLIFASLQSDKKRSPKNYPFFAQMFGYSIKGIRPIHIFAETIHNLGWIHSWSKCSALLNCYSFLFVFFFWCQNFSYYFIYLGKFRAQFCCCFKAFTELVGSIQSKFLIIIFLFLEVSWTNICIIRILCFFLRPYKFMFVVVLFYRYQIYVLKNLNRFQM
jgi:hypothetical protein